MRGRLWCGLVVATVCVGGCVGSTGPQLSAQDPDLQAAILAASRGDRLDKQVRAQAEEQEPSEPVREPTGLNAVRVAVLVNGQAILEEEARASSLQQMSAVAGLPEPERSQKAREIYKNALNTLIERELVMQDIRNSLGERGEKILAKFKDIADKEFRKTWMRPIMEANGLKSEEALHDLLQKAGTSFKAVKYGWERNFITMEYLRNRVFGYLDRIGHSDIEQYYNDHPDEFTVGDSVVWQDIFIDASRHPTRQAARQFAESLAERSRNNEDFVKLAETYDNGDASLRKNAVGVGNKRGEIQPAEVETVLFRLQEAQTGPVVELPTGFHVVRVLERVYAGKKPFDEKVQKQIRDKLRSDLATKEMKRIVNELKARAIIEYVK